jgi:hypothetical protein
LGTQPRRDPFQPCAKRNQKCNQQWISNVALHSSSRVGVQAYHTLMPSTLKRVQSLCHALRESQLTPAWAPSKNHCAGVKKPSHYSLGLKQKPLGWSRKASSLQLRLAPDAAHCVVRTQPREAVGVHIPQPPLLQSHSNTVRVDMRGHEPHTPAGADPCLPLPVL